MNGRAYHGIVSLGNALKWKGGLKDMAQRMNITLGQNGQDNLVALDQSVLYL